MVLLLLYCTTRFVSAAAVGLFAYVQVSLSRAAVRVFIYSAPRLRSTHASKIHRSCYRAFRVHTAPPTGRERGTYCTATTISTTNKQKQPFGSGMTRRNKMYVPLLLYVPFVARASLPTPYDLVCVSWTSFVFYVSFLRRVATSSGKTSAR